MKKIKILGIPFDVCTADEAIARVVCWLRAPRQPGGIHVVTPNPEMLLAAEKNKEFREILNQAALNIPDGIGILWAATFQTTTHHTKGFIRYVKALISLASLVVKPAYCTKVFPERITGVDFMQALCSELRESDTRIFLLGAAPGIAERTSALLEARYKGLQLVGSFSGSPREADFPSIQTEIESSRPDLLFVAYGAPAQELWIRKHLQKLTSVKVAIGVGGAFDFIAGKRKRAPRWLQLIGLEWLYRLIQEPSRIKRIYNATIKFPLRVIFRVI